MPWPQAARGLPALVSPGKKGLLEWFLERGSTRNLEGLQKGSLKAVYRGCVKGSFEGLYEEPIGAMVLPLCHERWVLGFGFDVWGLGFGRLGLGLRIWVL